MMARQQQQRRRRKRASAVTSTLLFLLLLLLLTISASAAPPSPAPSPSSGNKAKASSPAPSPPPKKPTAPAADVASDADAVISSGTNKPSSSSSSGYSSPWPPEVVRALKKTVVNIDLATPVALVDDKRTAATGTGFVVDAAKGLLVTNRHISTVSPTIYQVRFNDGSFAPAHCVYYDVAQDFAILKVDPKETTYNLTAVELGTAESLRVGDPVLIIGNNEGYVFSAIEGVVSDLRAISDTAGVRPSLDIETTFDSSSGSSGSPVWDAAGKVVAVNYAGDDSAAREVPIDYVTAALDKINKNGGKAYRGDAGVVAMLVPLGEATRNFHLPSDAASAAAAARPKHVGGTPKVIVVKTINPRAPAEGVIKPGDVIFSADGVVLADDLFALDRIMDKHVNSTVPVVLYRDGKKIDAKMPTHDLEALKARRFVRFGGGAFHDLTERTIYFTPVEGDGVMMAYSDAGTSFNTAAGSKAVVTELNGERVRNLNDFIAAAKKIKHGEHGSFVHRNPSLPSEGSLDDITYDLRFNPLEVFEWDEDKLEWVKQKNA